MLGPPGTQAPYAPASAIVMVIEHARDRGITAPVTTVVLERVGVTESLSKRTLASLKLLDLVTDDGGATETLEKIRLAPGDALQGVLADWVRAAYKPILEFIEPSSDVSRITDQFRHYDPPGMRNRMVTLFLGLCAYAGLVDHVPPIPRASKADAKTVVDKYATKGDGTTRKKPHPSDPADPSSLIPPVPPRLDSLISAYIEKLPAAGASWSGRDREKWLAGMAHAFNLIYVEPAGDP